MPNVFYFIELIRNWRIDTQQVPVQISPSTPIINVIPNSVEEPEKKKSPDEKNAEKQAEAEKQQQQPKQGPFGWFWTTIKGIRHWLKSAPGEPVELQTMLPSSVSVQKPPPAKKAEDKKQEAEKKKPPEKAGKGKGGKKAPAGGGAPGICLMTESPYRIIK
ncbi:PREDICTED: uncharacterized protein LOC108558677, partial [Nicrophorus vespilloides]|uniref:Uncharacterized protein LOC108558677 n=1 Tax=Nicrophorus vespilloides TaxID=110193 RepID=A0ABM1M9A2_NICVS